MTASATVDGATVPVITPIEPGPVTVEYGEGYTVPGPRNSYSSARVDVRITVSSQLSNEKIERAYTWAQKWVQARVAVEIPRLAAVLQRMPK